MPQEPTRGRKPVVQPAVDAPPQGRFPVVGLGASAGGLEALTTLLRKLPFDTGMAYVLVQHLSPDRESMLPEILAKATRMAVHQVVDGMRVQPDTVYVIPPNASMGIVDDQLTLAPRVDAPRAHRCIDYFFSRLADDRQNRAIGVVLSGAASDGTLGCEAIKAAGGLVLVQSPGSARHTSMPESVIATGCADLVLAPDDLAGELQRIGAHPHVTTGVQDSEAEEDVAAILHSVRAATDVDFTTYKQTTIRRRITRRMAVQRITELSEYARFIRENRAEQFALFQDLLIKVTSFFRDPEAFETLKDLVFPALFKQRGARAPIRIWVPGCSTGEEAYSIAIALAEYAGDLNGQAAQIFATDISEAALDVARLGSYPEGALADLPAERLRRFFIQEPGAYRIRKDVRDLCLFARQDVTRDPPFSRLDLISCRNLLIYLEPAMQARVIPVFHYALKPSGYLMLGVSETVGRFSDLFSIVHKKAKIFARHPTARARRPTFDPPKGMVGPGAAETTAVSRVREPESEGEAHRILSARYLPPCAIVDAQGDVRHFHGDLSPFLEHPPGKPSSNVFKLLRGGLHLDVRRAFDQARKTRAPARSPQRGAAARAPKAVIEVVPLPARTDSRTFMVVFLPAPPQPAAPPGAARSGSKQAGGQSTLRRELETTRKTLQAIIEEQETANEEAKSANEELLSSNEELQSTTEELETSKEELQASNEELTTLNDQLNAQNQELTQLNRQIKDARDTAEAVIETVRQPLLILDTQLIVKRANRAFYELTRAPRNEVHGRPFQELEDGRWNAPDLMRQLQSVLANDAHVKGYALEYENRDSVHRSLQINASRMYLDSTDALYALVALEDVSERRRAEEKRIALAKSEAARAEAEAAQSRAALLSEIGALFQNRQDLDRNMESIGRLLTAGFADACIIDFEEAGAVRTAVAAHRDEAREPLLREVRRRYPVELKRPHGVGFVLREKRAEYLPDITADLRRTMAQDAEHLRLLEQLAFTSSLVVPMIVGDTVVGAITLATSGESPRLSRKDLEMAELLAERVALAVENTRLNSAVLKRNEFFAIAAHELKTPLTPLQLYAEKLAEMASAGPPSGAETERMTSIAQNVARLTQRITHLINALLDATRLASGRMRLEYEDFDLLELVQVTAAPFRDQSGGLPVDLTVAGDGPVRGQWDRLRVEQLVSNLLSNAVKYGGGKPIRVGVHGTDDSARLEVRDSGLGMSPATLRRLFDPFERGPAPHGQRGLGLGLYIVRMIIDAHGGTVDVTSEEGNGSTFTVVLPRKANGSV